MEGTHVPIPVSGQAHALWNTPHNHWGDNLPLTLLYSRGTWRIRWFSQMSQDLKLGFFLSWNPISIKTFSFFICKMRIIIPILQGANVHISCSVVSDSFVTPWTVARQAPLSMEFSRQEYWIGLPFPSPGDLLVLGIKPGPLHCRWIIYHSNQYMKHDNTGNYTQYLVIIYRGKESETEYIYIYI